MVGARERNTAAGRPYRIDRVRELRQSARARGAGFGAHEQVCRGLSRQTLLWRLRVRRHRRAVGDRPRQKTVQCRVCECPAAFGFAGQFRGVYGAAQARRYDPRHVARAWRPSDARLVSQLQRQDLPCRDLWTRSRDRSDRLRSGRTSGARTPAEDDSGGRVRVFTRDRLAPLSRDRRQRRRAPDGGHCAPCRLDSGRTLPEPRGRRGCRHEHHAQDAARAAWRFDPGRREICEGARRIDFSGQPGRAADARDCGQGSRVSGGAGPRFQKLPAAGDRQCPDHGADPASAWFAHCIGAHGLPSVPGRFARQEHHRQGCRGCARPRPYDGQQERHSERSAKTDRHQRHPARFTGDHHARFRHFGNRAARRPHRRCA